MQYCKPQKTPAVRGVDGATSPAFEDIGQYAAAIGSLMYAAVATRPDIAYAVNKASQATAAPTEADWLAVKRIMRYLKGTVTYGILFKGAALFCPYSDADWAGCDKTRRSTSGVVCKMGTGVVTWSSRKQQSVALSTTEAEIVAASEATKEIIWIQRLKGDIYGKQLSDRPVLLCDNAGAIRLIRNPEFHRRTKHIEIRHYFVRERCEAGIMDVRHVSSEDQLADIMTKALERVAFERNRVRLGMCARDRIDDVDNDE